MTKAKEALSKLWNNSYFREYRTIKDIKEICLNQYGCTCANWAMILKSCKFLRKDKTSWIQKHNPKSEDQKYIQLITGETPWTDRNQNFLQFINQLKGDISIV